MAPHFVLTAITCDPALAARVDAADIDRIGIDIERLNKAARQGHLVDARISGHELADLERLAPAVRRAALFARLNPIHDASKSEIDEAIGRGARVLMLPFFSTAREVEEFVRLVDKRAEIVLLLETAAALVRLDDILSVPGVGEVIVGLNDLRLSTGLSQHFELVSSELMTWISDRVRARGLRFGFGGLARAGDDRLPIPSDLVVAQHARLGSTSAWLSRSFFGATPEAVDIGAEVARLRDRLDFWARAPRSELLGQRELLCRRLGTLAGP